MNANEYIDYTSALYADMTSMRGSRGGGVGGGSALEFAKLNIANITGNEKISYFSYLCTSTVIHQTESILLKVGTPWKNFLDPRLTRLVWIITEFPFCFALRVLLLFLGRRQSKSNPIKRQSPLVFKIHIH